MERRRLDRRALRVADEIRVNPVGRHERAREVARELSFDVWNALRLETLIPTPQYFLKEKEGEEVVEPYRDVDGEEVLPRKFWAQAILGVIARRESILLWAKIFTPRPEDEGKSPTFVDVIASLSAAFGVSMKEVRVSGTLGVH